MNNFDKLTLLEKKDINIKRNIFHLILPIIEVNVLKEKEQILKLILIETKNLFLEKIHLCTIV